MPSVEENRGQWDAYDWSRLGHEWSDAWGGTENLWEGVLLPRLRAFFPCRDLLEIGPGGGRFTAFLIPLAARTTVVDVSQTSLRICRQRFRRHARVRYLVNDGFSLDAVPDSSVDFAFSFDSLVHAEVDVLAAYIVQLGRKLRVGAGAFLHHSNFAELRQRFGPAVENAHWRAESVSAAAVRDLATRAGLVCAVQERVNWGASAANDCFSLVKRPRAGEKIPSREIENLDFMRHAAALRSTSELWAIAPGVRRPPGP